jgi:hypothetical protein
MGIDVTSIDYLMQHKDRVKGRVLQLGRQGMHTIRDDEYFYGLITFRKYDSETDYNVIYQSVPHSDAFFHYLGAEVVESIDYSAFEQATYIHDLNDPVPQELENKFDFIFDGGTIEHIFDVKMTMQNIKKMLKVGGTFMSVNMCNGHVGHGFYQFSPELYRTVFSKENGFNILSMKIVEIHPLPKFHDVPEPTPGNRQVYTSGSTPLYICATVEKFADLDPKRNMQQSDYIAQWNGMPLREEYPTLG